MIKKLEYSLLGIVGVVIFGALVFQYFAPVSEKPPIKEVAGAKAPTPTVDVTPIATVSATPTPIKLSKNAYVIAGFGDSMIDTMGENLDYLDAALKKKYPGVTFKLYNYGIGATTVENGVGRWDSPFSNRERNFQPISTLNADVIILGSYSYNPFSPHDLNKRNTLLAQLIQKAKATKAKVYLLAEIAPLYDGFGQGPRGPNMTVEAAHDQADKIFEQLASVAGIANTQGVPLIDAFTPTRIVDGKYGNRYYTNADDGIHPSAYGNQFTADVIVKTIRFN